jgi:hypothetical protein
MFIPQKCLSLCDIPEHGCTANITSFLLTTPICLDCTVLEAAKCGMMSRVHVPEAYGCSTVKAVERGSAKMRRMLTTRIG